MSLPLISIQINNTIHAFPEDGKLLYQYKPLQNLKVLTTDGTIDLVSLSLNAFSAGIDINSPLIIDTEPSYDDSVNLIINDKKNPLKIINSRFYLVDSNTYKIGDRKGNLDTNIYTEENFKIEAGLVKTVRSIITLDFKGIESGGNLPVGSYNFYFKLADSDGNESDFISESGKVVCHIGAVNHPSSIRGGQMDEVSDKVIKFQINNLDLAYDYINIYYTKHSGNNLIDQLKSYKITDKFKIRGISTELTITGFENHVEIDNSEINIQYANFDSAETNTNCQNLTFVGNITKSYELFKILEKYSLFITPELSYDETIGNLSASYTENNPDIGYEYYNTKNIYYKLGYWDEDIYRFGIIYILPDYTLSPVFNIRGIKELTSITVFDNYERGDELNFGEDFILEKSNSRIDGNLENIKGVFKINSDQSVFNGADSIKPIGLKFKFQDDIVNQNKITGAYGLRDLTKGFFFVRQKRIPTLLTQAVGIATTKKSYTPIIFGQYNNNGTNQRKFFSESFLKKDLHNYPILGRSLFEVQPVDIQNNALLCPEACVRTDIFNNYFNSSEFILKKFKYSSGGKIFNDGANTQTLFNLGDLIKDNVISSDTITTNLLLVEPEIELINNGDNSKFCSKAGDPTIAWKFEDPILGNINSLDKTTASENTWSDSTTKIRGGFNTFLGSSANNLIFGQHYNIFQKDYDFSNWKNYFRIRYNDSSPFMAIGDRLTWDKIGQWGSPTHYRGDCFISTYTHRVLWNFIDPELPTNNQIVDPYTWYKNFKVRTSKHISINNGGALQGLIRANNGDSTGEISTLPGGTEFEYKKLLSLFTYGGLDEKTDGSVALSWLCLPDGKKFKKYSEANGTFGSEKINRPDVNAVGLGHWVTFKICSNINLAMRDIDFSRPQEEAIHKMKRSFHPLQEAKITNKLPESTVMNNGINHSLSDRYYFEIPDVPFIKTNFTNRIYYSELLREGAFKNGNRVFKAQNFHDYTMEYGALVSLVEWYGTLIAVMEHGVLMIPVNERAMMMNAQGENVYINTETVLPKNPKVLSNTFGTTWANSIVFTPKYIYGLDTIGKRIWRTNGNKFETISDMKIQKFLNDNINLRVTDVLNKPENYSIKSHYNAFKQDVLFVFSYNKQQWHLCWNELLNHWVTRNTWFPEFSENINNIFYTFANTKIHSKGENKLYKHGFAGTADEVANIKHTVWYEEQHPFEFEFVVAAVPGVQKIFDNLKIISNKSKPDSFNFEIVGEGYDWHSYKEVISWLNDEPLYNYSITSIDGIYTPVLKDDFIYTLESNGSYKINTVLYQSSLDKVLNGYRYLLSNFISQILIDHPEFPVPTWINPSDYSTFKFLKLPFVLKDKTVSLLDTIAWEDFTSDTVLVNDTWNGEDRVLSNQDGKDFVNYGRTKGNMHYVEDSWDIQIQPIKIRYAYLKDGEIRFSKISEMRIRDKYIKIRVKYDGKKHSIINALRTLFTISYA